MKNYNKLYELVNEEGKELFTFVKRTNHFVVLGVSTFASFTEVQEKLKRVKQILYVKFENELAWIRIKGGLNRFMGKLNGSIEVKEFDRFDRTLWLWYIENETPFRYRWILMMVAWFFWRNRF